MFPEMKMISAFISFAPWEIFCRLLIFFQNQLFRKILSGITYGCQTDWIQIMHDIVLGLIWVQSVCKGCEQTTLVGNELKIQV